MKEHPDDVIDKQVENELRCQEELAGSKPHCPICRGEMEEGEEHCSDKCAKTDSDIAISDIHGKDEEG